MVARIDSTLLEIDCDRCENTYGVAPCTAAGSSKCYNTFATCQDKANFDRGVQTIRFTGIGAPIPLGERWRPYVESASIAAVEIDPTKGLALRSSTSVKLRDETEADRETDPYLADRAADELPAGTFWRRLLARNKHLVGRPARISRAFVDGDGVRGTPTVEHFIIEAVEGPDAKGDVTISLKDPIKLADRAQAPTPSKGKLAVPLLLTDMQLELQSGEGDEYPSSGYVRVGDEIIRYDGKVGDVLSWSLSSYRATWGTEAAEADEGELVQQCLHFDDRRVWQVLQTLLNLAGIADGSIDLAGFEEQDDTWLGQANAISTLIADPTEISTLLKELCEQTLSVLWWSPTEQTVRWRMVLPDSPAAQALPPLTADASIVHDSFTVKRQDTERLTFAAIYYGLGKATEDPGKTTSYRLGEAVVDTDAESANEYGDRRTKVITSRWFHAHNARAMRTLVRRLVARYRDPPRLFTLTLDPKDEGVRAGDLRDITHPLVTDVTGRERRVRVLVTRRERSAAQIKLRALETTFDRRYGFIAPAGTADYPNNDDYACVSDASGLMNDGTSGYLVI